MYLVFIGVIAAIGLIVVGTLAYEKLNKTKGIMLMIEFEGTEGLENFAYELDQREIPSILMADSSFVNNNCDLIKELNEKGVEIGGVYPAKPLWDVPYEEQIQLMGNTKTSIETCTGKELKVFASKYFAYDENTIRAAEELGIEYVMARGTTKAKATIYQPDEYDVKIFSVSNVDSEKWGTGSLCDYSYWAREGSPEDFESELLGALDESMISPVSHTYIGGLKARWNEVYIRFFDAADEQKVEWLNLDEFGSNVKKLPYSEIPENREVQYDQPKPAIPLDEEENVNNPCRI